MAEQREWRTDVRDVGGDEPIELQRRVDALRRSVKLMLLIIVLATATAVGVSLLLPKTYRAQAAVLFAESGQDSLDYLQRQLTTAQTLVTTPAVLRAAARRVRGETAESLKEKVEAKADGNASILYVSAVDRNAAQAAEIADAVAVAFGENERRRARLQLAPARERILAQLRARRRRPAEDPEVLALREQLATLILDEATAGSEYQVAESAQIDTASPPPLRSGLIALLVSAFFAVAVALARDHLRSHVRSARELSRLAGVPLLATIPRPRSRRRGRPPAAEIEEAAYETLKQWLALHWRTHRSHSSPGSVPFVQHVIVVTSVESEERKASVVAGLGRSLARAGHATLLISADLRSPNLDEYFAVNGELGVAELLEIARDGGSLADEIRAATTMQGAEATDGAARLDVIPAGWSASNPSRPLSDRVLATIFNELEAIPYSCIVVDAPPLLGSSDAYVLLRSATSTVIVADPDRLHPDVVADLREGLAQLNVHPLGLVAIGDDVVAVPYVPAPAAVVAHRG